VASTRCALIASRPLLPCLCHFLSTSSSICLNGVCVLNVGMLSVTLNGFQTKVGGKYLSRLAGGCWFELLNWLGLWRFNGLAF